MANETCGEMSTSAWVTYSNASGPDQRAFARTLIRVEVGGPKPTASTTDQPGPLACWHWPAPFCWKTDDRTIQLSMWVEPSMVWRQERSEAARHKLHSVTVLHLQSPVLLSRTSAYFPAARPPCAAGARALRVPPLSSARIRAHTWTESAAHQE